MKLRFMLLLTLILCSELWTSASTTCYFSPHDNIQTAWVEEITAAKQRIDVSCYGLSNAAIAAALSSAKARGVTIRICIDRTQSANKSDRSRDLAAIGIEVVRKPSGILEHNKFGVFDGHNVLMGSWNLSESAQAQDNSDILFKDEATIAQAFEATWTAIYTRDKPIQPVSAPPSSNH